MAETINISKMSEKLSKGIFLEFLWGRMEHTNLNWPCEDQENHEVKTHPSDVVFWYDEPYSQSRTYVNCDLKSYAKGSISTASMREAIESLAKTIECAEKSQEFNDKYIHQDVSPNICGLESSRHLLPNKELTYWLVSRVRTRLRFAGGLCPSQWQVLG
jgi:hypothetical protein